MIRRCSGNDIAAMESIVNEAAQAYRGAIPSDQWHEPYMPRASLEAEIAAGVEFWGWDDAGELVGVMGLQQVKDATLIRHAYVRTRRQRGGIGSALMRHGFRLVTPREKDRLLDTYWTISPRQRETSVVLVR